MKSMARPEEGRGEQRGGKERGGKEETTRGQAILVFTSTSQIYTATQLSIVYGGHSKR